MKKHHLKTISLILIISVLSSCNSRQPNEIKTEVTEKNTTTTTQNITTSPEIYETIATTIETEMTTTTEEIIEEEFPKDFGGIVNYTTFSEGVAFIKTEDSEKYAIDCNGNVIFKFDDSWNSVKILPEEGLSNGMFVYASERYTDSEGNMMSYLLNKSGEVVMSPKINGYSGFLDIYHPNFRFHKYMNNGYILAYKLEKKYTGNVFSLGVIGDNGKWIIPLRSDFKLSNILTGPDTVIYLGESVIYYNGYCYDFISDEIIAENIENPLLYDSGIITCEQYIYNTNTKSKVEFKCDETLCFNNVVMRIYERNDETHHNIIYNSKGEVVLDLKNYNTADIDWPEYEVVHKDGYTIIPIRNELYGDKFIAVFNENGELVFEPVAVYGGQVWVFFENNIITIISGRNFYQYTSNGNKITDFFSDDTDIAPYDFNPVENLFISGSNFTSYSFVNLNGETIVK